MSTLKTSILSFMCFLSFATSHADEGLIKEYSKEIQKDIAHFLFGAPGYAWYYKTKYGIKKHPVGYVVGQPLIALANLIALPTTHVVVSPWTIQARIQLGERMDVFLLLYWAYVKSGKTFDFSVNTKCVLLHSDFKEIVKEYFWSSIQSRQEFLERDIASFNVNHDTLANVIDAIPLKEDGSLYGYDEFKEIIIRQSSN